VSYYNLFPMPKICVQHWKILLLLLHRLEWYLLHEESGTQQLVLASPISSMAVGFLCFWGRIFKFFFWWVCWRDSRSPHTGLALQNWRIARIQNACGTTRDQTSSHQRTSAPGRQGGRQAGREAGRQAGRQDGWMDGWMNEWMDGWCVDRRP
jgi:hypothetical protein